MLFQAISEPSFSVAYANMAKCLINVSYLYHVNIYFDNFKCNINKSDLYEKSNSEFNIFEGFNPQLLILKCIMPNEHNMFSQIEYIFPDFSSLLFFYIFFVKYVLNPV